MKEEPKNHQYNSQSAGGFRPGPGGGHRPGPGGFHGMPTEKAKDFKGTMKRLIVYLQPYKVLLALVLAAAILSTTFTIAGPKIMGKAITSLFTGIMMKMQGVPGAEVDFDYILYIIGILAGLYVLSALFSYIQQVIMANVAQKTIFQIRGDLNNKLARLPLKFYDTHTHGELLSRMTNDVDNIGNTLQQSITTLITAAATLLGVVIMMLTISPLMTLICVVTLPMGVFIAKPIISRSQKYFADQQKTLGDLNGHVEEMFTGHKEIKAYNQESNSITEFDKHNTRLYAAGWRAQFVSSIIMPLMMFVNNIGYVLVCIVGSVLVTKRAIELGDIQAFIQYARQFSNPIMQTATIANVLQSTMASAERVFAIIDETEEVPDSPDAKVITEPQGDVAFDNVRFSYTEDAPLFENLNLRVQPGQTIAIVGHTGAGKTTLVNLLMRFYDVTDGSISIDGIDIRRQRRGELRRIFGMVLQDTWLFNGTIRENIAYGRIGATEEEVVAAAVAAHADHFIRTLPDGYNTVLNEDASNISQGQKQLLTIARAILANPAILILDEATSSVDTRTEIQIQKAMSKLMKGRTSFVIAHRLSTIRNAEAILVMAAGKVVEQGNHYELLAKGGAYADLYNSQFSGTELTSVVG